MYVSCILVILSQAIAYGYKLKDQKILSNNYFFSYINLMLHVLQQFFHIPCGLFFWFVLLNGLASKIINLQAKDVPLHIASRRGNLEIVKMLVEAGADIYIANKVSDKVKMCQDYISQHIDACIVSDFYHIVQQITD